MTNPSNVRFVLLPVAALALIVSGCGGEHSNPIGDGGGGDDASAQMGSVDGGGADAGGDFCSGNGPVILLDGMADGGAGGPGAGSLAQVAFRYALCTCEDLVASSALSTDAYDSQSGQGPIVVGTDAYVAGDVNLNGRLAVAGTLTLPCGRYYLERVAGSGTLTLHVTGRVVLFVEGDVAPQGDIALQLDPKAELDLFIGGTLVSSANLDLGSEDNAARLRIYIGGNRTINLQGRTMLGGNLYAPAADLTASSDLEVWGALFVRRLARRPPSPSTTTPPSSAPAGTARRCAPAGAAATVATRPA